VRRRSLEDEGRHMWRRGGDALTGSTNLMVRPNPYGPRWASPLAYGF
jgi:hypothetical protein